MSKFDFNNIDVTIEDESTTNETIAKLINYKLNEQYIKPMFGTSENWPSLQAVKDGLRLDIPENSINNIWYLIWLHENFKTLLDDVQKIDIGMSILTVPAFEFTTVQLHTIVDVHKYLYDDFNEKAIVAFELFRDSSCIMTCDNDFRRLCYDLNEILVRIVAADIDLEKIWVSKNYGETLLMQLSRKYEFEITNLHQYFMASQRLFRNLCGLTAGMFSCVKRKPELNNVHFKNIVKTIRDLLKHRQDDGYNIALYHLLQNYCLQHERS